MIQWTSKIFKHYFFICYVFCSLQLITPKEYCAAYDKDPANNNGIEVSIALNTPPPIPPAPPIKYEQTECVKYYKVDLSTKRPTDKYLIFEINFDSLPMNKALMPVLIEKNKTKPEMDDTGYIDDDADFDVNGYLNRKTYYNILVDLEKPTDNILYFGIYQYTNDTRDNKYKTEKLTYTISVRTSSHYLCQRDCSGNRGSCRQDLKQCVCNRGWFDMDCSRAASEISFEGTLTQQLMPQAWNYFFIDAKDYGGNLKFSVQKNSGTVYLTFLFQDLTDFMIPNFDSDTYDGRFLLEENNNDQNLKLPENGFKMHLGGRMMVGAYNVEPYPVDIRFSVGLFDKEETSRSAIMYVMIGIASGLVVLWIIFSILKYRAYRHAALVRRQQQLVLMRSRLTREEIEEFFPQKSFDQLKSSFPQTLCSICLDDFRPETICRQLYCEHIYHGPCIQEWFGNHPSCPFCKKDMTRGAIEEFLKNPNGANEAGKPADGQEGNIATQSQSPEKDQLVSRSPPQATKDKTESLKEISIDPPSSRRDKDNQEGIKKMPSQQVLIQNAASLRSLPIEIKEDNTEITGDLENRDNV